MTTQIVKYPTENDVKAGRGNGPNRHRGNIFFRSIVDKNKVAYTSPSTSGDRKERIIKDIICQIQSQDPPGRFLKEHYINNNTISTGLWVVMDHRQTVRKVGQALREKSRKRSLCDGDLSAYIDLTIDQSGAHFMPFKLNNKRPCETTEVERNPPNNQGATNHMTGIHNGESNGPQRVIEKNIQTQHTVPKSNNGSQRVIEKNIQTQHTVPKCNHDQTSRINHAKNLLCNQLNGKTPPRRNFNMLISLMTILANDDDDYAPVAEKSNVTCSRQPQSCRIGPNSSFIDRKDIR